MYKIEIKFDPNNLTPDDMDRICEQTDRKMKLVPYIPLEVLQEVDRLAEVPEEL